MTDLPGGASIPVTFLPGQPLTANELNKLQKELMLLLLTHTHTGNDQPTPQGALIGPDAIQPNAVKGPHIGPNAVTKGDIHNGAVGASEIQEKCVASNHLVDGAVGTAQIKDKSVTMAKLADEVLALLNTPREGATTFAYCAYMEGKVAYPIKDVPWFNWILEEEAPIRLHDLPIRRQRDDGGWQPIRSIVPPDQIKQTQPPLDLTTRAEMATSLASLFKQNETVVRDLLGGAVAEVKSEGSQWNLSMATGEKLAMADADVQELLGRLDTAGADLSRAKEPMRTNTFSLTSALEQLSKETIRMEPTQPILKAAGKSPTEIIWDPSKRPVIDPEVFLDPTPSDDLEERARTAMLVDPKTIDWDVAHEGTTLFQPAAGGNAVFNESGQAITFKPEENPSKEELVVIERMLYHYDFIDQEQGITPDQVLNSPKIYDFLNHPHFLATGYWTGASRNIRAILRMNENGHRFVRVRFATPYTDSSYVVSVTPDFTGSSHGYMPISAHVLRRKADYVDLLFLQGTVPLEKPNFSIAIHGELVQS